MSKLEKHSRRDFLKLVGTGTCGAMIHRVLAPTAGFLAFARPLEAFAATNKVLIILNFSGGISYNITPPYNSRYIERNPNVGYTPSNSINLTADQGLHPSLTNVKTLWDANQLALFNLVGYPNANRSHDESTSIWHTGSRLTMGGNTEGWGARMTSQMVSAFGGVSLAGSNDFTKGGSNPPRIVSDFSTFGERPLFYSSEESAQVSQTRLNVLLDDMPASTKAQEYVKDSISKLQGNVESLKQVASQTLPVTFPNTGLGSRFRDAARLIAAGSTLNVNLIYIEQGGHDTHANEKPSQTNSLNEVNGALGSFVECMQALGKWQDVTIATMTEFTRTMENSSQGTDHGASAPLLVMGGSVSGGQKTPAPSTEDVGSNEYIKTTHCLFSQVFGEIVAHMGFDPMKIFPYPELPPAPYKGIFA